MYYKLGALFLLGSLSISAAMPPCVCTRNLRPVCGSDGQTYSNECMLRCARVSKPHLFMKNPGTCGETHTIPLRHVREVEVNCFCTFEHQPFCGTDGNTYSNRCALNCAKQSTDVEIAYEGECQDGVEEEPNHDVSRHVREAEVNCFCTYEYQPFCGTDGNTYSNRCALNCAKQSSAIEIAYQGECRSKRETVQVAQLPSRCSCPRNFAPVCGSDDETYDNNCVLDCLSQRKPGLRLQHDGPCGVQPCTCSREVIPVCGTDGITYDNACFLNCAKAMYKDIDLLHEGKCDDGQNVVDTPTCSCTREGRPVCGTDGNTYGNPCLLKCARDNDQTLHIDYEGPCDNRVKVVETAEIFPCSCTRNLQPVCASNGVTFSNKCLMKCAGTHLKVDKEGPCDESDLIQ